MFEYICYVEYICEYCVYVADHFVFYMHIDPVQKGNLF